MGGIGLASAEEISSWLDLGLHKGIQWKESFLGYDLEALSPSIMVLCVYTKIWRKKHGNSKLPKLCRSRNQLHKD